MSVSYPARKEARLSPDRDLSPFLRADGPADLRGHARPIQLGAAEAGAGPLLASRRPENRRKVSSESDPSTCGLPGSVDSLAVASEGGDVLAPDVPHAGENLERHDAALDQAIRLRAAHLPRT